MKYICLLYQEEAQFPKMSREEQQKATREFQSFAEDIKKSGNYETSAGLAPTSAATTVRVRNGKMSTTDGPFAETKEQLGGFFLINAKDLNEAIQIAAKIPGARWGAVEVRPLWDPSYRQ